MSAFAKLVTEQATALDAIAAMAEYCENRQDQIDSRNLQSPQPDRDMGKMAAFFEMAVKLRAVENLMMQAARNRELINALAKQRIDCDADDKESDDN